MLVIIQVLVYSIGILIINFGILIINFGILLFIEVLVYIIGILVRITSFEYLFPRKGAVQARYRLGERLKDVNFWRQELKQEISILRSTFYTDPTYPYNRPYPYFPLFLIWS